MTRREREPAPQLPGYTLQRTLGSGGFSDVFLYEQDMPRRQVAVKVLSRELPQASVIKMFNAEGDMMARLSGHPSILTVFETNRAPDGRFYLVMEYCPGTYANRYRKEVIDLTEVLNTAVKISSAVEVAHRAGIVHRDIKPSNILVTKFQAPVLSDFGIALSTTSATGELDAMSVPWSAPEVLNGRDRGSAASDLWSLGATIYTLLAGRSPFAISGRDNTREVLKGRILKSRLTPIARMDVPEYLQNVLLRCLDKNPSARFGTALEIAQEFQAVEYQLGLPVTPVEVVDEAWLQAPAAPGSEDAFRGQTPSLVPIASQRQRQFVKPEALSLDGGIDEDTVLGLASQKPRRPWVWAVVGACVAVGVVLGGLALMGVLR